MPHAEQRGTFRTILRPSIILRKTFAGNFNSQKKAMPGHNSLFSYAMPSQLASSASLTEAIPLRVPCDLLSRPNRLYSLVEAAAVQAARVDESFP